MNVYNPYGYYPYGYNPQPYYQSHYWSTRQFPPVNPEQFHQSANQTKILMKEASKVLNKLADSKEFDQKIMTAAQASQTEEVKRLIKSAGVTSDVDVQYTPDGLRIEFKPAANGYDCCKLQIGLRWR